MLRLLAEAGATGFVGPEAYVEVNAPATSLVSLGMRDQYTIRRAFGSTTSRSSSESNLCPNPCRMSASQRRFDLRKRGL